MFFKDKYVYTCPDVIHQREMTVRNFKIATATNLVLIAGILTWGYFADKKMDREFEALMDEIPDHSED